MDNKLKEIEWSALLDGARRYKWVVLAVSTTAVLLTLFWSMSVTPIYRATAELEYNPNPSRPLGSQVEDVAAQNVNMWMTREWYQSQNRIIRSRTVSEMVVTELGLQNDQSFMGHSPHSPDSRGNWFFSRWFSKDDPASAQASTVRAAAERLRARVDVQQVRETRMVEISVDDIDPERAAQLANAIANAYRERATEERLRSTVRATEYLSARLESMQSQIADSDQTFMQFKRDNNILWASIDDQREVISRNLLQYSQTLADTRGKRIQTRARLEQLRAAVRRDGIQAHAELLDDNSEVRELRRLYHAARVESDELASRYGPNWPDVRTLDARKHRIEVQLNDEIHGIIRGVTRELSELHATERGLEGELTHVRQRGEVLNSHAGDYESLSRAREGNAQLYSLLLKRSTEAGFSHALRVETVHEVDPAIAPITPISPRMSLNLVVGWVCGLVLGIAMAFVLSRMNRMVRGVEDVEATGLQVLGSLPAMGGGGKRPYYYARKNRPREVLEPESRDLIVHTHPMSAVAESIRAIRTNLTFMAVGKKLQTMVVVSPSPRDGKTTVAVSLAIAFAQTGERVLLMDTDLRRPRLHRAFQLPNRAGVTSVVLGDVRFQEAVVTSEVPNVSLLTCGPIPPNPSELLHTPRFAELVALAQDRFDRVIFDSPPLGAVTDGAVLATQMDGAVLVLKDDHTTRDALIAAHRQLKDVNAPLLGAVINQLNAKAARYRGGYRYQYRYARDEDDDDQVQDDAAE